MIPQRKLDAFERCSSVRSCDREYQRYRYEQAAAINSAIRIIKCEGPDLVMPSA